MGNGRSGWYGNRGGSQTTDSAIRITIAGIRGWQWRQGLGSYVLNDDLWVVVHCGLEYPIEITFTDHYPNGNRRWFRCGMCSERRTVLFIKKHYLACRQCHRMVYASQMVSYGQRKLRLRLLNDWKRQEVDLVDP